MFVARFDPATHAYSLNLPLDHGTMPSAKHPKSWLVLSSLVEELWEWQVIIIREREI